VVAGAADVALDVELVVKAKGEGGVKGCGVRNAAAGSEDRLVGVGITSEDGG